MFRKLLFIGLLGLSAVLTITPLTAQDTATAPVTLNGSAQVIRADIQAINGVIHVIDAVLVPPQDMTSTEEVTEETSPAITDEASTTDATSEAAGTDEATDATSEVASIDEIGGTADAMLDEISATNTALFGEISSTGTAIAAEISTTGTAIQEEIITTGTAIQAEVMATGTALQNEILGTPAATEDIAATEEGGATEEADTSTMTVLEILQSDPELSIGYAAIEAAGLAETLGGAGPFTLFIPDNAAFEAYFADNSTSAEGLFQNIDRLTDVLLYHVVSGQVLASDLVAGTTLATLNGESLEIGDESDMGSTDEASGTEEAAATDEMSGTAAVPVTDEAELTPEMTPEA